MWEMDVEDQYRYGVGYVRSDGAGKVPGMGLLLGVCVAEVAISTREWWMTAEVSSPGLDEDHDPLRTITVSGADLFSWSQSLPFPYTPKHPSNMADQSGEIDLDSVIDRLLEGEWPVFEDESTVADSACSPRQQAGQSSPVAGIRDQVSLHQSEGDLYQPTYSPGTRSANQDMR